MVVPVTSNLPEMAAQASSEAIAGEIDLNPWKSDGIPSFGDDSTAGKTSFTTTQYHLNPRMGSGDSGLVSIVGTGMVGKRGVDSMEQDRPANIPRDIPGEDHRVIVPDSENDHVPGVRHSPFVDNRNRDSRDSVMPTIFHPGDRTNSPDERVSLIGTDKPTNTLLIPGNLLLELGGDVCGQASSIGKYQLVGELGRDCFDCHIYEHAELQMDDHNDFFAETVVGKIVDDAEKAGGFAA